MRWPKEGVGSKSTAEEEEWLADVALELMIGVEMMVWIRLALIPYKL